MNRALFPYIQRDLKGKIVLLAGPRQVGKTTLSKSLVKRFLPEPFEWTYKGFKRPVGRANVAEFVGRLMFS